VFSDDVNANFDLSSKADEAFVAELLFVYNAGQYFSEKGTSLLKSFSFHFESPQKLANKYGVHSKQYKIAIQLLDKVLDHVINSKSKTSNNLFDHFTIFYLPSTHSGAVAKLVDVVKPKLEAVATFIIHQLPHVYFNYHSSNYDHVKATAVCDNVRGTLTPENREKVICRNEAQTQKRVELQNPTPPTPPTPPAPGPNQPFLPPAPPQNPAVSSFQIVLWVVVCLFSTIGGAIFCLCGISGEAQKDIEIYGETRVILEKANQPKRQKE